MLKVALVLLSGGAALVALAGDALSSPQFTTTYELTYSTHKPGATAGFDALVTWSDAGEPFGKPREIQKLKLIFHPGSRLDTSALPVCRASDQTVQTRGLRACPAATKLGSVEADGLLPIGARFDPTATLFNARQAMIVVVTVNGRFLIKLP